MSFDFGAYGNFDNLSFGCDLASPAGYNMVVVAKRSSLGDFEIIACEHLPKTRRAQFRFPRSKKKRMRKKWAKRQENWREVDATGDIYFIGRRLARKALVHPDGYERLKKQFGVVEDV